MNTDFRNEWLSQLGQRINIPELSFDDKNLCQLMLDEELAVTIYRPADPSYLVLFGQLPVSSLTPDVMQQMLVENRNYSKQAAPILSVSETLDSIEIHFKFNQSELEAAEDAMGQLVGCMEYWRGRLTGTLA